MAIELHQKKCVPCEGTEIALEPGQVAEIAETEQHHPDIYIFYNRVKIELYTHAIGGLSENDFIMAAKIDKLKYR